MKGQRFNLSQFTPGIYKSLQFWGQIDSVSNQMNSLKVAPYSYSDKDRESLFIVYFNSLNDEMIDRYTGDYLELSDISESAVLTGLWRGFSEHIKTKNWKAMGIFLGTTGMILMLREMLGILAMKKYGNLKPEIVYNTTEFQKTSRKCDVFWDGNGKFIEFGPLFEGFLKRHPVS